MRKIQTSRIAVNHVEVQPRTLKRLHAMYHESGIPIDELIAMAVDVFATATKSMISLHPVPTTKKALNKAQRTIERSKHRAKLNQPAKLGDVLKTLPNPERNAKP